MCQSNYNTENNNGKHLTYEDRTVIAHLFNIQNMNYTEAYDYKTNTAQTTTVYFDTPLNLNNVVVNHSYIKLNNTGFNITSTNDINISVSYLNSNIAGASSGDTVLTFTADTSGGLVWFNLSGFEMFTVYTVYRDGSPIGTFDSTDSDIIHFSNNVWSDHDFDVVKGSFDGSRTVLVNYEHDLLGATYTKGVSTISLFSLIMVFAALGVGVMFLMMIKGGRN